MTRDRRAIDAAAEALSGILERERRTGTLDPSPELDALEGEHRAALQEMLVDLDRLRTHRASIGGSPVAGDHMGRYKLLQIMGEGATSVVWRAHDPEVGRLVAVKILHPEQGLSELQLTRFQRESRIAGSLSHRGVLTLLDIGSDRGLHFIVTEFIEDGRTLARLIEEERRLAERNLTGRAAARFLLQLADAVGALHQAGVVHRDLKPANVLLSPSGTPVVADLGLATRPGDGGLLTSRSGAGTPFYRSPEQVRELKDLDARSDVFSLGVTVYEVLTGRRPFEAASTQEVNRLILERDPTPLRQVRSDVPADLETICLHALEKDPARRYPDAAELAADLRRFLDHRPIHARAAGPVRRLLKLTRRRPVASTALTALVALLLVAGVALRSISERSAEVLRANAELQRSQAAVQSTLVLAEDALRLLLPGATPSRQESEALVRLMATAALEQREVEAETRARELSAAGEFALKFGHLELAARAFQDALEATGTDGQLPPDSEPAFAAGLGRLRALRLMDRPDSVLGEGEPMLGRGLAEDRPPVERCLLLLEVFNGAAELEDSAALERLEAAHGDPVDLAAEFLRTDTGAGASRSDSDRLAVQQLLASLLHHRHRYDEAFPLIERTFGELRDLHGLHDYRTLEAGLLLSRTLNWALTYNRGELSWDRLELAELLWPAALSTLGEDSRTTSGARWVLAESLLHADRWREALDHYRAVERSLLTWEAPEGDRMTHLEEAIGVCLSAVGRLDEAEVIFRRTARRRAETLGPDHHDSLIPRRGLAEVLIKSGRFREALEELAQQEAAMERNPALRRTSIHYGTIRHALSAALQMRDPEAIERTHRRCMELHGSAAPHLQGEMEHLSLNFLLGAAAVADLLERGELEEALSLADRWVERKGIEVVFHNGFQAEPFLAAYLLGDRDLPLNPDSNWTPHWQLAAHYRRGELEPARRLLDATLEHFVDIARSHGRSRCFTLHYHLVSLEESLARLPAEKRTAGELELLAALRGGD